MGGNVDYDSDSDDGPRFGPVYLNAAATSIILKWKHTWGDEVRRRGGRTASAALISDDDSDDDESVSWAKKRLKLNAASKALAIRWLRMARARNPSSSDPRRPRDRLPGGRSKPNDKKRTFGANPRSGKKYKPSRSQFSRK